MPTQNSTTFPHLNKRIHNLNGQHFGQLLVIGYAYKRQGVSQWLCKCDCGTFKIIRHSSLKNGNSQSCGCATVNATIARCTTHGYSARKARSSTYGIYAGAKARCTEDNHPAAHNYKHRGIKFCFDSFEQFIATVGERPSPDHTLDRKDNDGNYSPENCQWATRYEQSRNTRTNVLLTINGVTKIAFDWAKESPVKYETLLARIRRGWCDECAVTLPLRGGTCVHNLPPSMPRLNLCLTRDIDALNVP